MSQLSNPKGRNSRSFLGIFIGCLISLVMVICFTAAITNATMNHDSSEKHQQWVKAKGIQLAPMNDVFEEKYGVRFSDQQLIDLSCRRVMTGKIYLSYCVTDGEPSKGFERYGSTIYTKENGQTVKITLIFNHQFGLELVEEKMEPKTR